MKCHACLSSEGLRGMGIRVGFKREVCLDLGRKDGQEAEIKGVLITWQDI